MNNTTPPFTRLIALAVTLACLFGGLAESLAAVTRGPYLQMGSPNAVTIRWRTDVANNSRVWYGTAVGSLTNVVTPNPNPNVTDHEVRITGLSANTKYFYAVGTTSGMLAGNNSSHFVVTHPPAGTAKKTRVWALGDSGMADANAAAVRDAYYTFTGSTHTDLWLMLGDNAYETGTDAQFQAAVFNMYPEMLRKSVLWSTRGNHESTDSTGSVYYNIHTFPTQGQSGGVSSGSEAYYSFDYGNIHFICLDSQGTSRATNGAMANWLRNDLSANTRAWTVAFWHHPPYSKGSHDSDDPADSSGRLVQMRENFLPILEDAGVDLVVTAHSHSYERSFLLDGHYGFSNTLQPSHKKDAGSGREDGSGAYQKATVGPAPHQGAVYVVNGSGSEANAALKGHGLNHPAMYISWDQLGSLVMDFDGDRVDVKFLRSNGTIGDYFTLIKGQQGGGGGGGAFKESGGQVVMEGENFHLLDGRTDPNGVNWYATNSVSGAVGGQYLETPLPLGTVATWANGCEARYNVKFTTTGTYNVWVRRYAINGDQNSGFAGLDGAQTTSWDNQTSPYGQWVWKQLATVNVTSTGVKTFQLRRREAGYKVDRIVLTTSGTAPSGNGPAESPQVAFQVSSGQVVMEAENFHRLDRRTDPDNKTWQTANSVSGAVGGQYLETPLPLGTVATWANGCETSYKVNFTSTGTYNVWVRRYAVDGDQNSGFAGLDGTQTTSWDNQTSPYGQWVWKQLATVNVTSTGVKTFQLRRREAGYKVDRIVLTTSGTAPSGNGPAESPQQ